MSSKKFDLNAHPILESTAPIFATGQREPNGPFNINYSSILTKLIQEAGRWCRSYASDLFIDWKDIDYALCAGTLKSGTYLFGFRELGVDDALAVASKYNAPGMYSCDENYYRTLWRLDITVKKDGHINMALYEIHR